MSKADGRKYYYTTRFLTAMEILGSQSNKGHVVTSNHNFIIFIVNGKTGVAAKCS